MCRSGDQGLIEVVAFVAMFHGLRMSALSDCQYHEVLDGRKGHWSATIMESDAVVELIYKWCLKSAHRLSSAFSSVTVVSCMQSMFDHYRFE